MTKKRNDLVLIETPNGPEVVEANLGGGQFVGFSQKSPDKESDNEDTLAAFEFGEDAVVLMVADGAGGLPAGRRASQTAIQSMITALRAAIERKDMLRTGILNGFEAANKALLDLSNGCATTMAVVTVDGRVARSYHVGDSEVLIVGQRGVVKLKTTAHSPTAFAVEAGFLDKRAALHHEERHLVFNFLGTADMRVEIGSGIELASRDTVMLASDGLTDNVHLDEIINVIRHGLLKESLLEITGLVEKRMAASDPEHPSKPDDLSVLLYRKPVESAAPKAATSVANAVGPEK